MVDLETFLCYLFLTIPVNITIFWTCFGPKINWLPLGSDLKTFLMTYFFVKMVKILPCGYCVYSKHAQNFLKDNLVCIVILKLCCKSIKVV